MKENIFTICIRIGLQMKFEFDGTLLSFNQEEGSFTFGEMDDNYAPKNNGCMIVVDIERKAIAFNSLSFSMKMDILGHKKVDDNYYFKCATDLCRVDVYICERDLWKEQSYAIFY